MDQNEKTSPAKWAIGGAIGGVIANVYPLLIGTDQYLGVHTFNRIGGGALAGAILVGGIGLIRRKMQDRS